MVLLAKGLQEARVSGLYFEFNPRLRVRMGFHRSLKMYSGKYTKLSLSTYLCLIACAAMATDIQKYGVTFESAANGVSNDFAYVVGDYIANNYYNPNSAYHSVVDGEPYGWFAFEEDESEIIARTDAAGGQALQLNTDAGTLTNKLQKGVADEITAAIATGGAYIELDAKFVASDMLDAGILGGIGLYGAKKSVRSAQRLIFYRWPPFFFVPNSSSSPLFAIYAYKDEEGWYAPDSLDATYLVVFHGVMDSNGGITYTNEIFNTRIDTETYTKLRIEIRQLEDPRNPGTKYNAFSIRVDDGAALSSVTALDALFGGTATGTWFMTVEDRGVQAEQLLSSLNFKGCGEIDNIKVGVAEGGEPLPPAPSGITLAASAILVGAGEPTPVTATVAGGTVDSLVLFYKAVNSATGQGTWNTMAMEGDGTTFFGNIPAFPTGTVLEWYVTDGIFRSTTYTLSLADRPDYNRCHDGVAAETKTWVVGPTTQGQLDIPESQQDMVNGWKYDSGSHSNLVAQAPNGSQWKASGVGIGITGANLGGGIDTTIGMAYPSLYFQNLPLSEIPFIRSPRLHGGVGTIDFRTQLIGSTIKTSELTLQVAYTDGEPGESDWIDVAVYKYGTDNGGVFSRICHEVLNDYGITYVRIVRTGCNIYNTSIASSRLAVDNICITKPAADVGIIEKLKNPGYPAADQDILMRCAVTNCVEATPAVNRRVSVKYQYVAHDTSQPIASAAAWASAEILYKGKDENGLDWYEGTIPAQRVGYVWYYYQVDYDGYHYGENPLTGASESISPAYWDAGTDTHVRPTAGAKFQVRPYRSRYARVALDASPAEASVEDMTLVGDEQWQTVIPVRGLQAVSSYFIGYGYYEDDASAYEATPVVWGENNPDVLSDPTITGFLESSRNTTVTSRLVALNETDYNGFYLYRFHSNDKDEAAALNAEGDRRYDYIVKKAVYQDFDDWTASPDYYECSLGGLPTLTYAENFDGNAYSVLSGAVCVTNAWEEDAYDPDSDIKCEDFQEDVPSDEFYDDDVWTPKGFIRTGSRIAYDRKAKNTDTFLNTSMALRPHGKIQNTSDSMPYGLEKITFKARASVDDDNFAIYKGGTDWNETNGQFPQYISATWELVELSPAKPYFSYIFLYQPSLWDGASWYELRIVQTDSYNANNDTVNVELWRHSSDGVEVRVGTRYNLTGFNLKVSRTVNVVVDRNGTKLRVRIHLRGGNPSTIYNNITASSAYIEDTSPINLTSGGTVGFGVFDAVPNITSVKVGTTYGGTELLSALPTTYADWYAGGNRPDGQPRWRITSSCITRPVPTQTIGIYAVDCEEGANRADTFPSTPLATRMVTSFSMSDFTVSFKAWNKKFVQIRNEDGEGFVVLDDIECHPWRAVTRCDTSDAVLDGAGYREWTSVQQQDKWLDSDLGNGVDSMSNHWAVLEGWVANSGPFRHGAHLERSRANTNLVQGVVSPMMPNGMGSISFTYSVSGGKVVYGVERTDNGDCHSWMPVAVFMNAAGDIGERYAKIGEYFGGCIRVRIYGAVADVEDLLLKNPDCGYDPAWGWTDDNAKLQVDNLRVKDYPEDVNDTAWRAYNALITDDAPDGLVYGNSGKSCFFNNSPTNGVYGIEEFLDDDPYLESPPLYGIGVGEIALQYRIVPGTAEAGTDGHLVIKVAPRRDTPLAEWRTITNLVVSADGTAFVKFDNERIFEASDFVVRIYNSKLPGTPRIVIDNVLVTAPARPSFEFEYVRLLPEQPLSGKNTMVEAKIMREIMNPKNVRVYVSYHKYDTNDVNEAWGVANWFNPLDGTSRIQLEMVGEQVFRTREGCGIPAFAADDLVEFVVWGMHDEINILGGDSPVIQNMETFELPEWYRTLDLSENQIVPMDMNIDKGAEGWSPYFWVYSCPPESFFVNEINNWRTGSTKDIDYGSAEYIEFAGPAGTDIGGWKLMLVHNGGAGTEDMEYTIPPGARLRCETPTGWGFYIWGDSWASTQFRIDAAFPDSTNPLNRNIGDYAGILVYRPNGIIEQMVRFGTTDTSVFTDEYYWEYAGQKLPGHTDSISRISMVSDYDGGERIEGQVASDFTWAIVENTPDNINGMHQVFADLGGNVVVALYDPEGNEITDEDVLDWIARYNAEQSDIDALGTMDKFNEEFLLNLDLTKECVAELKITSIHIEDGTVTLGVSLSRSEDGSAVGLRAINGRVRLLGRENLSSGTFSVLDADVDNGDFGDGNTSGIEYELPDSTPPAFFKVIVK